MKIEHIMSAGLLLIGFLYIFLISFLPVPESAKSYVDTILGFILGTALATVINYLWGSSSGSAAKSSVIEKIAEGKKEGL